MSKKQKTENKDNGVQVFSIEEVLANPDDLSFVVESHDAKKKTANCGAYFRGQPLFFNAGWYYNPNRSDANSDPRHPKKTVTYTRSPFGIGKKWLKKGEELKPQTPEDDTKRALALQAKQGELFYQFGELIHKKACEHLVANAKTIIPEKFFEEGDTSKPLSKDETPTDIQLKKQIVQTPFKVGENKDTKEKYQPNLRTKCYIKPDRNNSDAKVFTAIEIRNDGKLKILQKGEFSGAAIKGKNLIVSGRYLGYLKTPLSEKCYHQFEIYRAIIANTDSSHIPEPAQSFLGIDEDDLANSDEENAQKEFSSKTETQKPDLSFPYEEEFQ